MLIVFILTFTCKVIASSCLNEVEATLRPTRLLSISDLQGWMMILSSVFVFLSVLAVVYMIYALYICFIEPEDDNYPPKELSEAGLGISSSIGGLGLSTGGPRSISS